MTLAPIDPPIHQAGFLPLKVTIVTRIIKEEIPQQLHEQAFSGN